MFGGMIVLGTITVSGATGMPVAPGNDPVVMMDVVVNQVIHPVMDAFHHLVCHHLVVVVSEMVCEKDHHQEESRDSACEDHLA
jgi:hypothetical protein